LPERTPAPAPAPGPRLAPQPDAGAPQSPAAAGAHAAWSPAGHPARTWQPPPRLPQTRQPSVTCRPGRQADPTPHPDGTAAGECRLTAVQRGFRPPALPECRGPGQAARVWGYAGW